MFDLLLKEMIHRSLSHYGVYDEINKKIEDMKPKGTTIIQDNKEVK